VWTAVGVSHLIAGQDHEGVNAEIRRRLPVHRVFDRYIYVIEEMKGLLDDLMDEAGVESRFYSRAVAVEMDGSRVRGVIVATPSGLECIEVGAVVDATGDGAVAAAAGCRFEMGRPFDGRTQPVTLFGTVGGYRGKSGKGEPFVSILAKGGWRPSYPPVTMFPQPGQPGVFQLMATQFYAVNALDARELSRAEIEGRRELRKCIDIFRRHGGDDWKDAYLIRSGPAIGVRETRRVLGRYVLTWEDLDRGSRFEDGIARVRSGSNIHSVDNPYEPPPEGLPPPPKLRTKPYDIPYRSLVAADADNLLTAGRCISGDHIALGSYRLTGTVVLTGEAAGLGAAMAVDYNTTAAAVDPAELISRLNAMRTAAPSIS